MIITPILVWKSLLLLFAHSVFCVYFFAEFKRRRSIQTTIEPDTKSKSMWFNLNTFGVLSLICGEVYIILVLISQSAASINNVSTCNISYLLGRYMFYFDFIFLYCSQYALIRDAFTKTQIPSIRKFTFSSRTSKIFYVFLGLFATSIISTTISDTHILYTSSLSATDLNSTLHLQCKSVSESVISSLNASWEAASVETLGFFIWSWFNLLSLFAFHWILIGMAAIKCLQFRSQYAMSIIPEAIEIADDENYGGFEVRLPHDVKKYKLTVNQTYYELQKALFLLLLNLMMAFVTISLLLFSWIARATYIFSFFLFTMTFLQLIINGFIATLVMERNGRLFETLAICLKPVYGPLFPSLYDIIHEYE